MLLTNLLVFGFLIKIYSLRPVFTHIKEKHGIETLRLCRSLEKDIIRYEKIRHDLRFLLACKKEGLVPIFAKPKLSIKVDDRTRKAIANLIIKTELKNKHRMKKELKRGITEKCRVLRESLSFLLYGSLQYKIRLIVGSRKNKWSRIHDKKLGVLRKKRCFAN